MSNPIKAVIYCRVSTNEQAQHGVSLAAQEAAGRKHCAEQGLEVHEVITDDGFSASTLTRPGMTKLRAMVARRAIRVVVVARMDRWSRDIEHTPLLARELAAAGVQLRSVGEVVDTSTATGRAHSRMSTVWSQLERELIAERTKAAMAHKAAQGQRVGKVPYGMRLADDGVHLLPNDDEQRVIDRARTLLGQRRSLRLVSATLASEGMLSRTGKPLSVSSLRRLVVADVVDEAA